MKFGVGLPSYIPWAKNTEILEWARKADAGPFSSLGSIDRLCYGGYDPLIAFAGAAAVTRRIRFTTTVLLAPLRNTAILAKQAATLDALSGGRLTLGLGVGAREADYQAAEVPFKGRGKHLVREVERMKKIWSGQPADEGGAPIGPAPVQKGGPELLLGGFSQVAVRRVGRLADGFISGGVPDVYQSYALYQVAEQSWKEAGRPGKPRYVGAIYVALGPQEAIDKGTKYMTDYYGQAGRVPISSPQQIMDIAHGFADKGMDELFLWVTNPDLDQVDRIADLVGKM